MCDEIGTKTAGYIDQGKEFFLLLATVKEQNAGGSNTLQLVPLLAGLSSFSFIVA